MFTSYKRSSKTNSRVKSCKDTDDDSVLAKCLQQEEQEAADEDLARILQGQNFSDAVLDQTDGASVSGINNGSSTRNNLNNNSSTFEYPASRAIGARGSHSFGHPIALGSMEAVESPADRVEGQEEMVLVACEFMDTHVNTQNHSNVKRLDENRSTMVVEMMVDTGAQSSVISSGLVNRLGLWNKVNRRKQGVAAGVGVSRILGRLELVAVKLGHVEFQLNFNVLEMSQNADELLLLGIDQMRRFKCILDLEKQVLVFGGKGGVEVPLLPDVDRKMQRRLMEQQQQMGCAPM